MQIDIFNLLELSKRPPIFAPSTAPFWDDPHICKGLLKAHLDKGVDGASRNHATIESSVRWLCGQVLPKPPANILDLGCGPGLYSHLLAYHGYQVTGIDLSKSSLQYAKDKALKEHLTIDYYNLDYLTMDYEDTFQGVLLIYCDFGVLSKEKGSLLLSKIYHSLTVGGIFIFDVFTSSHRKKQYQGGSWSILPQGFWTDRPHLILDKTFHYEKERLYVDQTILIQDKGIKVFRFWEQHYTKKSIMPLLQEAGFKKVEFYGNIVGDPYYHTSKTLTVVAYK